MRHSSAAAIGTERIPQLHHGLNHAGAGGQPLRLRTKTLHSKPQSDPAEHTDAGSTHWTAKNGNLCRQQLQWPSMVQPVLIEHTDDGRAKRTLEHATGMQQPQSYMLQLNSRMGMGAGPGGTQLPAGSAWSLEPMPRSNALLRLEEYTGPTKCTSAGHTQVQPHSEAVAERSRCNAVWNDRRSATGSTVWLSTQLQSVHKHVRMVQAVLAAYSRCGTVKCRWNRSAHCANSKSAVLALHRSQRAA